MNKENFKDAVNQIHASEDLKQKTYAKINEKKQNKFNFTWRHLGTVAAVCMVAFFVFSFSFKNKIIDLNEEQKVQTTKISNTDLPRFESMDELKEVLKNNTYRRNMSKNSMIGTLSADIAASEQSSDYKESSASSASNSDDYSKTNIQVEGVDEADTVKTDGNYIYYNTYDKLYIVDSKKLKIVYEVDYDNINKEDKNVKESFNPKELYVNNDKLIVLGTSYKYQDYENNDYDGRVLINSISLNRKQKAKAIIYDITDRKNPKIIRQVELDGYYKNSRMIGDNIYFISQKSAYYYDELKNDNDLLPVYNDSLISKDDKVISYKDIAYFKDTRNYSYMLVAGFNINEKDEVKVETFFGANDTIYASQNNMYISQTIYKEGILRSHEKSQIYKFNLDNSEVKLQGKAEINGDINNQFSMDEYNGNLRIATTDYSGEKSTNQLYILDEDLNLIGSIENLAKGEKIYSVRFVGKIGYVVTFKEIDPLFVIDLSDPTKPTVKGKLKIPGYSSYLHPYDETHIIGIGYNTKTNEYGGTQNNGMKMSMFDVSDLENPKELFHVDIGDEYSYSEITRNHKALFYNKEKNLIGFPMTWSNYNLYYQRGSGFIIYKINLDKGFEKYGQINQYNNYNGYVKRIIYIGDTLYTISNDNIVSYDLNTLKEKKKVDLK